MHLTTIFHKNYHFKIYIIKNTFLKNIIIFLKNKKIMRFIIDYLFIYLIKILLEFLVLK